MDPCVSTLLYFRSFRWSVLGKATEQSASATNDASSRTQLSVVLLSLQSLFEVNLPLETLGPWGKKVISTCEEIIAKETNAPRLLVQITLRRSGDPVYEISGNPRLSEALASALQKACSTLPKIRPLYCDLSLRFENLALGAKSPLSEDGAFFPKPEIPDQSAFNEYEQASIAAEYAQVRKWANESALPMLGITASRVDRKFEGVVNVGNMILQTNLAQPIDVEKLTFNNSDYWRGVMEMAPGNHLVAASAIILFVANGEFDKAGQLLAFVLPFADRKVLAGNLLEDFAAHLRCLEDKVNGEIRRGIALNDANRFDEAISVYQRLLAIYPCSAWAWYELFFSEIQKGGAKSIVDDGIARWNLAAPEIYSRNPLYDIQYHGERGKTMGALLDRLELASLKKGHDRDPGVYYGRSAELAVRLECYGCAAHIYWFALNSSLKLKELGLPEKKVPAILDMGDDISRYLYCLEKLGCPDLKKNFKDEFSATFQDFDRMLNQHRTQ
jgi:tetratricopeptide (TPR) repeat protein